MELIGGQVKRFLNMLPRQFYTEAAQKLIHEICETIYKELPNNGDKIPRKEIIETVETFIEKHLQNPPENPEENPTGIRDAISDSLAKNTLEIYKDDIMMMLLLKKIIEGDMKNGKIDENGIFYTALKDSVSIAKDPNLSNRIKQNLQKTKENIKKNLKENISNPINKTLDSAGNFLFNKKKEFAKNTIDGLINSTTVTDTIQQGGAPDADVKPDADAKPKEKNGLSGIMDDVAGKIDDVKDSVANKINDAKNEMNDLAGNLTDAAGGLAKTTGMDSLAKTTNIDFDPNKKDVLPYIQTNCNGSGIGLGLPNVDLNFLGKFFDGLKEPIAKEIVKKIQERLPDQTTSSLMVKRDIYDKILLVIESHLRSEDGKKMLIKHIDGVIEKEIVFLTQDDRPMKERLLKIIFKNTSSPLYTKMVEIIAENANPIGGNVQSTEQNSLMKGGDDNEAIPLIFDVDIQKVINKLLEWMNSEISPELNKETVIPSAPAVEPVVGEPVVGDNTSIPNANAEVVKNYSIPIATANVIPEKSGDILNTDVTPVITTDISKENPPVPPPTGPPVVNPPVPPPTGPPVVKGEIENPPPPLNGGMKRKTKKRRNKIDKTKTMKRNQTKRNKNKRKRKQKQKTNKNNRK
jgi:hypothetical protein